MNRRTFIKNLTLNLAVAPMAAKAMGSTVLTLPNATEWMLINIDGNIGLGITNPTGTLEVIRDTRNVLEMAVDLFPNREGKRFCANGHALADTAWDQDGNLTRNIVL